MTLHTAWTCPAVPDGSLLDDPAKCRSVAQPGSAPRSGRGGRRFESSHSDHFSSIIRLILQRFFALLRKATNSLCCRPAFLPGAQAGSGFPGGGYLAASFVKSGLLEPCHQRACRWTIKIDRRFGGHPGELPLPTCGGLREMLAFKIPTGGERMLHRYQSCEAPSPAVPDLDSGSEYQRQVVENDATGGRDHHLVDMVECGIG